MKKLNVLLPALIALLSACTVSAPETAPVQGTPMTFTASFENNAPTRTVLDGTNVLWQPGDAIAIGFGSGNPVRFTNQAAAPSLTCDFTGVLPTVGTPDGTKYYYAIYPDNPDIRPFWFYDSFRNLSVPYEQTAVEGSFDPMSFPSVARSLDNHLYFKNVCGGMIIRFSIGCTQYRKVVIRANGLESLSAYQVFAVLEDDGEGEVPVVAYLDSAMPEVVLWAPEGGFKPYKDYYVSMLPAVLSAGYSVAVVDLYNQVSVQHFPAPREIKRSVFGRPGEMPAFSVFKTVSTTVENPGVIERQWVEEDSDGNKWLYDIGVTIPGAILCCPLDNPSFSLSDVTRYTLERNLFGDILLNLKGYYAITYYDVSEVSETSMTWKFFTGEQYAEDEKPSVEHFTAVTSPVEPDYVGLWLDVDGSNYDISISGNYTDMYAAFQQIAAANDGGLPIVYLGKVGKADDYTGVDVRGKVVVVNRGEIEFSEKVVNAANAGAIGVLFSNYDDQTLYCTVGDKTQIPHGSIYHSAGEKLSGKSWVRCFKPTLSQVIAAATGSN